MNKAILTIIVFFIAGALTAVADDHSNKDGEGSSFEQNFCPNLKLSEEQKGKMKEAMFNFREKKIDLKAALEKSKLSYERLLSDPQTDYKTAKTAADEISANKSKLISAKQDFKTSVAFEILKPEQREPALKCEKRRKHHMGFMRHHHEDEGEHGGNG